MTPCFSSGLAVAAMLASAASWSIAGEENTGDRQPGLPSGLEEHLLGFVAAKKNQAIDILRSVNLSPPYGFDGLFDSMQKGDVRSASRAFEVYNVLCRNAGTGGDEVYMMCQIVTEAYCGWEPLQTDGGGLLEQFGKDVLAVVPEGSVYFGGTDEGRFVVTAMSQSHADGRPFFTLTQNGLADLQYLKYLRRMYGHRITLPSDADFQLLFMQYVADARERKKQGRLKPGEGLTLDSSGRTAVTGQVAVMQVNGLLVRHIFQKNPDLQFYIEQSYPLEWTYPHLEPTGPVLKINRDPILSMTEEIVARDHEVWNRYCERLIGNWITYSTSADEICDFIVRVYERENYEGFAGDLKSIRNVQGRKAFSKLRSSIGGLYAWRKANIEVAEENARIAREAEFALKQAFAIWPYSPEALYRYTDLLASSGNFAAAERVVFTALRLCPDSPPIESLLQQVQTLRGNQVDADP